jgi:hypothetical protein
MPSRYLVVIMSTRGKWSVTEAASAGAAIRIVDADPNIGDLYILGVQSGQTVGYQHLRDEEKRDRETLARFQERKTRP